MSSRTRTRRRRSARAERARAASSARKETVVGHVIGLVLLVAGTGMVVSSAVAKLYGEPEAVKLLASGLAVAVPGLALWRTTKAPERVPIASIFATVLAAWVGFSLVATIPYLAAGTFHRFDIALFEGVAGFTTTASTVLRPIDGTAHGILFWRATTQWLGGIGIIVFVISVLPFLRSSGIEHLSGIAPGGSGDRLAPRVREVAKRLVLLYIAFTLIVGGLYAVFGMSGFDAVAHAFTTVSTGGFSTHNASFAAFHSASLEWVAIGAMIVAGGSFPLYWRALRGKPFVLFRSVEFRVYLAFVGVVALGAVLWVASRDGFTMPGIRETIFSSVSISTTTGYTISNVGRWAGSVQLLLLFAMGVGGMAGSTAGGFKVFRLVGVMSHARRHVFRQLHPRAVSVVRIGKEVIPEAVVTRVLGFFALFMMVGAAATFLISAIGGLDLRSAISGVATSLGNVGPGFGVFSPTHHYLDLHAGVRGVLMVVMLLGRLEIFPVILGIVPFLRFVSDRLPTVLSRRLVRLGRG